MGRTARNRFAVAGLLMGLACSSTSSTKPAAAPTAPAESVAALTVSPNPVVVSKGNSKQVSAVATLANGSKKDVTDDPATTWTSENTKTATVDPGGHVVGVGIGVTTVKASFAGATSSVKVTVTP
jgi:hypothetical protein